MKFKLHANEKAVVYKEFTNHLSEGEVSEAKNMLVKLIETNFFNNDTTLFQNFLYAGYNYFNQGLKNEVIKLYEYEALKFKNLKGDVTISLGVSDFEKKLREKSESILNKVEMILGGDYGLKEDTIKTLEHVALVLMDKNSGIKDKQVAIGNYDETNADEFINDLFKNLETQLNNKGRMSFSSKGDKNLVEYFAKIGKVSIDYDGEKIYCSKIEQSSTGERERTEAYDLSFIGYSIEKRFNDKCDDIIKKIDFALECFNCGNFEGLLIEISNVLKNAGKSVNEKHFAIKNYKRGSASIDKLINSTFDEAKEIIKNNNNSAQLPDSGKLRTIFLYFVSTGKLKMDNNYISLA